MLKKNNGIKEKIALLQEKLKQLQDENKIGEIQAEIAELEKQLPNPIWKKIGKYLGIASGIIGIAYTILNIVMIFL